MTSYLTAGWFERKGKKGLRTEVIDGAMDAAGFLLRAGIQPATVLRVALRVRALVAIADPRMIGIPQFTQRERDMVMNGLSRHTDKAPELHAFVADCLDRVDNLTDLMAFYLHLTHVARMIELLSVAMHVRHALPPARATSAERKTKRAAPSREKAGKKATKKIAKKIAKKAARQPAKAKAKAKKARR